MTGPPLRTDLVDVYPFRTHPGGVELLQLRRCRPPSAGHWHPIMGHIEQGERAAETALRELREEAGLDRPEALWQLEQVHPFFIAERNEIYLSPRFTAEVPAGFEPSLNDEHDGFRWIPLARAETAFLWPGQHAAIAELRLITRPGSPQRAALRVPMP